MIDSRNIDFSSTNSLPSQESFVALNHLDRKLFTVAPDLFADTTYYVEAGANDGIKQSNTYYLEKVCGAKGLLVEPALNLYERLIQNRSSSNIFRCGALVSKDFSSELVKLIYCDLMTIPVGTGEGPESGYELKHFNDGSSALPKAMLTPIIFGAQAFCLSDILVESEAPISIDLLSLDVEGAELGVLHGIDFELHSFRYILIETWNIEAVEAFLLPKGYEPVHRLTDYDYLFRKKSNYQSESESIPDASELALKNVSLAISDEQQTESISSAITSKPEPPCFVDRLVSMINEEVEYTSPGKTIGLRENFYSKLLSLGLPPIEKQVINSSYFESITVTPLLKHSLLSEALKSAENQNEILQVNIYGLFHSMTTNTKRKAVLRKLINGLSPGIGLGEIRTINPDLLTSLPTNPGTVNIIFTNQYALFLEDAVAKLLNYLSAAPGTMLATYFTDSHHMLNHTAFFAAISDFLFLGHPTNISLASSINPNVYLLRNCLTQWEPFDAFAELHTGNYENRSQELFGWHNEYPQFPRRNKFLKCLNSSGFDETRLITNNEYQAFARLTAQDKLRHWLQYDHSIVVPTLYDLPIRFFDALSTGQNVLVPLGCTHLDKIIPCQDQQALGIFRYQDESVDSVTAAFAKALDARPSLHERLERSLYVARNHAIANIVEESLTQIIWRIALEHGLTA